MKYTPFPCYDYETFELKEGTIFKLPLFCKNYNNICSKFYRQIIDSNEGFYTCPYGFGICKRNINGTPIIYTGLNIEKYSLRKEMIKRIHDKEFLPKLSIDDFNRLEKGYEILWSSYIYNKNENKLNRDIIKTAKESKLLIDNTVHELRKLNNQIKMQSETLKSITDEINCNQVNCNLTEIKNRIFNIFSTSQLVSTRLDAYDFSVNPDIPSHFNKASYNVYKKFEKASHCLELLASEKNITIIFNGKSQSVFEFFRIFELVPFMLFENAIKYSPENENIYCEFKNKGEKLSRIILTNKGPRPEKGEILRVKEKNYRSNVVKNYSGQGLGLYIADTICEYHNIKLTPTIADDEIIYNGILFSTFSIVLNFDEITPVPNKGLIKCRYPAE